MQLLCVGSTSKEYLLCCVMREGVKKERGSLRMILTHESCIRAVLLTQSWVYAGVTSVCITYRIDLRLLATRAIALSMHRYFTGRNVSDTMAGRFHMQCCTGILLRLWTTHICR